MERVEVTGAGAFQGYRTLRCGALEFGTTTAPRSYEADLVGGLGSKTSQASIWAWAQQNGHAVSTAAWSTKVFKFTDVDANTFRFPDLRDVFTRFAGTDADTGQAVVLGSYKADTLKAHAHGMGGNGAWVDRSGSFIVNAGGSSVNMDRAALTNSAGSAETAPKHTAFMPRIHI